MMDPRRPVEVPQNGQDPLPFSIADIMREAQIENTNREFFIERDKGLNFKTDLNQRQVLAFALAEWAPKAMLAAKDDSVTAGQLRAELFDRIKELSVSRKRMGRAEYVRSAVAKAARTLIRENDRGRSRW